MAKILTCRNLTRNFDHFSLKDIDVSLEEGYLTGLIGGNGAGKTTLLRILAGLDLRFRGEVFIGGISVREAPLKARELTGYVSENLQPFWEKTALENGDLIGSYFENYEKSCLEQWLDRLGVPGNLPVHGLSKGDTMKFFCCMALSHKPKLLLLDEPAAGFDPVFRREFLSLLRELTDQGISVLMTSHITEDLEHTADYLLRLENGRLVQYESIEDFHDRFPGKRLAELFPGSVHIHDLL